QGLLRRRAGTPAFATASHTALSLARAPARPPSTSPAATATAFTAPALVPLIQPTSIVSSSSRRSSTPQVKAPCAPPPSSARLRRRFRQKEIKEGVPHSPLRSCDDHASATASEAILLWRNKTEIAAASWQHVCH